MEVLKRGIKEVPMGVAKIQDSNSSGTHLIITYNHTLHNVLNMKYGRGGGGGVATLSLATIH